MNDEHFLGLLDRAIENDELTEHEAWLEWQLFQEQGDENYYGYV